jgi:hypothetical protein
MISVRAHINITSSLPHKRHYILCIVSFRLFIAIYLADIRASFQLQSHSLCKHVLHWVGRVQAVKPEVFIDRYSTSRVVVILSWSSTIIKLAQNRKAQLQKRTYFS